MLKCTLEVVRLSAQYVCNSVYIHSVCVRTCISIVKYSTTVYNV